MASYNINALSLPMYTHLLMQCCSLLYSASKISQILPSQTATKTRLLMGEVNTKYCPQKRARVTSCYQAAALIT